MLITDEDKPFGDLTPDFYDDELLYLAHDLASRLLPAFDNTLTGIPYPRVCVHLWFGSYKYGQLPFCVISSFDVRGHRLYSIRSTVMFTCIRPFCYNVSIRHLY